MCWWHLVWLGATEPLRHARAAVLVDRPGGLGEEAMKCCAHLRHAHVSGPGARPPCDAKCAAPCQSVCHSLSLSPSPSPNLSSARLTRQLVCVPAVQETAALLSHPNQLTYSLFSCVRVTCKRLTTCPPVLRLDLMVTRPSRQELHHILRTTTLLGCA